jgi:serine/threonine protein kinase
MSSILTRSQAQIELSSSRDEFDCNNNVSKPVPPMALLVAGPASKHYMLGEEMEGKGRFGKVLAVKDRITGEERVLRRVRSGKDMNIEVVSKLVKQLLIPRHPNIVKYQGAYLTAKELCLAMTMCNCPLTKVMPLSLNKLLFTCKEVVNGLAYLHHKGMVHGAVRASNVLLDKDGRARLGDWGLQTVVERDRVLQWEAPEVRRGGQVTKQSDVWSIGVLVVECVKGSLPYQSYRLVSPLPLISQEKVTPDCYSLVKDCLYIRPDDRPDIETISRHKYLQGIKVDRVVGREMLVVGGRPPKKEDGIGYERDSLDCGKCGELTNYSLVFENEGGSTPFLCDNCVEVEEGHQDCEEIDCEVCMDLGRVLRTRWKRQDNLDKLVGIKMEKKIVISASDDSKDKPRGMISRADEGPLSGKKEDKMFDVLMSSVKEMQARMLGQQGVEVRAGVEKKCGICSKLRVCILVQGQSYCCMTCMARNMEHMVCSMCGDKFNTQDGKVSVNGDYFCQPCVAQLAKEAV